MLNWALINGGAMNVCVDVTLELLDERSGMARPTKMTYFRFGLAMHLPSTLHLLYFQYPQTLSTEIPFQWSNKVGAGCGTGHCAVPGRFRGQRQRKLDHETHLHDSSETREQNTCTKLHYEVYDTLYTWRWGIPSWISQLLIRYKDAVK